MVVSCSFHQGFPPQPGSSTAADLPPAKSILLSQPCPGSEQCHLVLQAHVFLQEEVSNVSSASMNPQGTWASWMWDGDGADRTRFCVSQFLSFPASLLSVYPLWPHAAFSHPSELPSNHKGGNTVISTAASKKTRGRKAHSITISHLLAKLQKRGLASNAFLSNLTFRAGGLSTSSVCMHACLQTCR